MKRAVSSLILLLSLVFVGGAALAQQRGPAQRVVEGKVQDKSGAPVKGATIYLKDTHTMAIKSFFSGDDGSYHITQLSPTIDYNIWAELDGKKSATHPISSFDTKKEFTINLKVDTSK